MVAARAAAAAASSPAAAASTGPHAGASRSAMQISAALALPAGSVKAGALAIHERVAGGVTATFQALCSTRVDTGRQPDFRLCFRRDAT